MTNPRSGATPEQTRRTGSRRRARSAVVANYIREISTRDNGETPKAGLPKLVAADSVGCA